LPASSADIFTSAGRCGSLTLCRVCLSFRQAVCPHLLRDRGALRFKPTRLCSCEYMSIWMRCLVSCHLRASSASITAVASGCMHSHSPTSASASPGRARECKGVITVGQSLAVRTLIWSLVSDACDRAAHTHTRTHALTHSRTHALAFVWVSSPLVCLTHRPTETLFTVRFKQLLPHSAPPRPLPSPT
jgi:hypothetical protein